MYPNPHSEMSEDKTSASSRHPEPEPLSPDDALAHALSGDDRHVGDEPVSEFTEENWLSQHPADRALVEAFSGGLKTSEMRFDVNVEAALETVRKRIVEENSARVIPMTPRPSAPTVRKRWYWRGAGLAAAAALVVAIGFQSMRTPTAPGSADGSKSGVKAGMFTVYRTGTGVVDSIELADGSLVILAPQTQLKVQNNFALSRVVELDGSAFFSVKHDETRPFLVHSRGAEIRDVGTAFSVRMNNSGGVVVSVTEGVVTLGGVASDSTSDGAHVELRAGDRGTFAYSGIADDDPSIDVRTNVVGADEVTWTRGVLSYRDVPVAQVSEDVKRWYGIDLRLSGDLLSRRTISATLRADSASQAIRIIALALGADVTQTGDTVLLSPIGPGGAR